ncbi:protein translocase subunit SecDF [Urechidicola vernalis]|uniref:Multifunctional fusion protein n=1 Tax=Urechidicola vernalis TaxID=3075600 RepID=A0ABU2Y3L9_9FLAO|nr:protein translocase subunit SecDF [Urechidicola sp. P050]MDT0552803.1 protein translocase subunit SecDF [Urechidicola sp. P050]
MQNKGLIKLFAILFGLVSLYQLSFTWFAKNVTDDAKEFAIEKAAGDATQIARFERIYLDSVANDTIVPLFNYSYNDIKDKSMNLGLDLKGGINAILQVSVKDILVGLSNDSKNPVFREALETASAKQKSSNQRFLDIFFEEFETASNGTVKLSDPSIFGNKSLSDKITFRNTNDEVKPIIEEEINASISTAFQVLRNRIDKFGVTQPNIQRIGTSGRILIELPGAKDVDRVEKLLQSTAELEFWEAYKNVDIQSFLYAADAKTAELFATEEVADTASTEENLDDLLGEVSDSITTPTRQNRLFAYLYPNVAQNPQQASSLIGQAAVADTAKVNAFLANKDIRALLPSEQRYAKFLWDAKPNGEILGLYAIKSNREDIAPIEGDVIDDARQGFDQFGNNPEVSMKMNSVGTKLWAKLTTENANGGFVAVVLDNEVHSAPRVGDPILAGSTSISGGNMTITEAEDLANVLKAGKLPAAAHIVQKAVVGPSLGQKAIDSSFRSFGLALILVLIWMVFYYGKAGLYANIALAVNILFLFGWLASFGAVLTLPGIAGIILTIGMSVDANVIIFERIKEELAGGKGLKEAIAGGFSFKGALSAILDANVTTFLTGVILFVFGTGPIKGFAYTLMLGIVTSFFTAVFITRIILNWSTNKNSSLTFNTNITKSWFQNINVDFLKKRKIAYAISGLIILGGIGSLFTNSLNYGVDFVGGRSYVVKFENAMNASEVAGTLKDVFEDAPEVKTYGAASQLKITTKFRIDEDGNTVDDEVRDLLFTGLQTYLPDGMTLDQFKVDYEGPRAAGIESQIKVEPTIADDIKTAATWAIVGSLLVVFLYILIRFRKWQYSLGAVTAVFHDVLIVLSIFSLLYKVMPFDMEIGQSFIAAILTVVGYSLNDTVVIFDRIREYTNQHSSWKFNRIVNSALSNTLGRTINTSITTLVVLSAIFLFGGDSIRGFMFALIVGVIVGTYSSLFIASPIMYDTTKKLDEGKK